MKPLTHNIVYSPVVLIVRAPIIGLLILLIKLGEWAEAAYDYLEPLIPGFRNDR